MVDEIKFVIITDLDGVITDTFNAHIDGWNEVAKLHGKSLENFDFEILKGVATAEALEIIRVILNIKQNEFFLEKSLEVKNRIRDDYIKTIKPADTDKNIHSILNELDYSVCRLVCFASTSRTKFVLKKLGISKYFSAVYSGDALKQRKIDSVKDVVIQIEQIFKVARRNIIVLDDSKYICDRFSMLGVKSFLIPFKGLKKEFYQNFIIPYLRGLGVYLGEYNETI